jgi:NAD(P)-dependent dehydrogenase (short-subunit alcohol dehydrogenase family)
VPDRTVLVTGSTGLLGPAVVAAFEREGWRVLAPTRAQADLTRAEDTRRIVAGAGALHALAHLVGGFRAEQPIESTPVEEFESLFALNLRPAYLMLQAAMPALRETGGAAVCVGSRAGEDPFAGAAGYSASKAALHALVRTAATEGVRCNAVVPRVIDDPEALAETIVFLAGERSRALNGALLPA